MKRIALIALGIAPGLALAGCGSREPLQPRPGAQLPPKSAMAARAPTTDELLTPTTLSRPDRVDELLTKSEPRQDDRFDLPPSGVADDDQTVPVDPDATPQ